MVDLTVLPARHGPFPGRLAPGAIAAYAAATGDQTPAVRSGLAVPAVFPVILVFEAQETARGDLPAAAWQRTRGGVAAASVIVSGSERYSALVSRRARVAVICRRCLAASGARVKTRYWVGVAVRGCRGNATIVIDARRFGTSRNQHEDTLRSCKLPIRPLASGITVPRWRSAGVASHARFGDGRQDPAADSGPPWARHRPGPVVTRATAAGTAVPVHRHAHLEVCRSAGEHLPPAAKTVRAANRAELTSAHSTGTVHGEHDIVLHRPLAPSEPLDTSSRISAVCASRAGTQVVVHLEQVDAEGRIAVEQWWTTHGLCTMAICTHRLLGLLGVDDPGRVARVAVRFASPTPLGEELTVNAYGIDQNSFAFEATSRDVPTITHGRLELRP